MKSKREKERCRVDSSPTQSDWFRLACEMNTQALPSPKTLGVTRRNERGGYGHDSGCTGRGMAEGIRPLPCHRQESKWAPGPIEPAKRRSLKQLPLLLQVIPQLTLETMGG